MSLRAFRIEKTKTKGDDEDGNSGLENEMAPTKDSGYDSQPKTPVALTPRDKERCLIQVRAKNQDYDIMAIQDALIQTQWDVDKATQYLREHCRPKIRYHVSQFKATSPSTPAVTIPSSNTTPVIPAIVYPKNHSTLKNTTPSVTPNSVPGNKIVLNPQPPLTVPSNGVYKRIKRPVEESDKESEESDFDEKPSQIVFDSDEESDEQEVISKDRKAVFEFFNNAKLRDLLLVKSLSQKKADIILDMRPFTSWVDLIDKIKSHKQLNTELLNNAQEYMDRQNSLTNIMKKCSKIVKKINKAIEKGQGMFEQPTSLSSELKLTEYQLVGINWLNLLNKNDVNGILADEMGLGKTIQVISFLAHLKETNQAKRCHLIVVPSSTLNNWDHELKKWCPSLKVLKYHGNQEDRKYMRINIAKQGLGNTDIMLTTYHMIGGSNEEKKMFRVTKFHYVVFDEAHMLKNMMSQRYALLMRIQAERRLLLTGTPLQNNLLELMSLLCFVMPSMIGSKAEDIKVVFQNKTKIKSECNDEPNETEQSQIEQAKMIMKPFLLRRLKKDVLSFLPPKVEVIKKVEMTQSQRQKYCDLVNEYKSEAKLQQATRDTAGITLLMDMRKLANHPLLLRYYFTDDDVHKMAKALAKDSSYKNTNPNEIFQDIAYLSDFKLYQMAEKHHSLINLVRIPDHIVLDCGKFKVLDELLPKLKEEGHRVLIFSQFVMMLDVIEKYLQIRQFAPLRLDGQTAVEVRQDLIDSYNKDSNIFIFLLSTRAGGLGINLTAADTVIIYDIDFNPYNDKQAEDRCHRIGQTKEVTIYRLISQNTIEDGMLQIAQDKLRLEQDVTSEEGKSILFNPGMNRLILFLYFQLKQKKSINV